MSLMRQFRQIEPAKPSAKPTVIAKPAPVVAPIHKFETYAESVAKYGQPAPTATITKKRRGPKPSGNAKELVSLRLSTDVIAKFRATGKGWQARIDEALRKATPDGRP